MDVEVYEMLKKIQAVVGSQTPPTVAEIAYIAAQLDTLLTLYKPKEIPVEEKGWRNLFS